MWNSIFKNKSYPSFTWQSFTACSLFTVPSLASCGLQIEPSLGMPDWPHWLAIYSSPSKPASPQARSRPDKQVPEVKSPPISEIMVKPLGLKSESQKRTNPKVKPPISRRKFIIAKESSVSEETNQTHHTYASTCTYINNTFNKSMLKYQ